MTSTITRFTAQAKSKKSKRSAVGVSVFTKYCIEQTLRKACLERQKNVQVLNYSFSMMLLELFRTIISLLNALATVQIKEVKAIVMLYQKKLPSMTFSVA